jgi:hypothetical protein
MSSGGEAGGVGVGGGGDAPAPNDGDAAAGKDTDIRGAHVFIAPAPRTSLLGA